MPSEIVFLAVVYAIPLARIPFLIIPALDLGFLRTVNAFFGRIEWVIRPWRDTLVFAYLLYKSAVGIYSGALFPTVYYCGFALISLFAWTRFVFHKRRVAEFGRKNKFIHPKEFFKCYYSGFGFLPSALPKNVKLVINPTSCSFKSGKPSKLTVWPVIAGVFNTWTISRIILCAQKWKGPAYVREVANSFMVIWGARVAQLGKYAVKGEGFDKLRDLDGKLIFAFNHKSFIDFAVAPLVLHDFNLRFLAAKDHFLNNPFFYLIMGKAMKAAGTIFVDRNKKGRDPRISSHAAVENMINIGSNIVIFPQGTRSFGNIGPNGGRFDAGYYTSGNRERLRKEDGHLKKGVAYIAVDTMIELKNLERASVSVVPVGLFNTATIAPKGKIKIQTEVDLKVKIAEPITLTKKDVAEVKADTPEYKAVVGGIIHRLDKEFKGVLETHAVLDQRFFTDIRKFLPHTDFEYVAVAMKSWRGDDYLVYQMLDSIYATSPKNWQSLCRELCHLLMSDSPKESFIHFRNRVVDRMIEGR